MFLSLVVHSSPKSVHETEKFPEFPPVTKQLAPTPASAPAGLGSIIRQLSALFVPGGTSKSKSEQSLQTETNSTVCLTQMSGDSSKSLSLSVRNKAGKSVNLEKQKQPADKTPAQHDLANRILNRLKKLPDISEGSSGNEQPDPTNNLAVLVSQFPAQGLDHKAVTPDQLSAYFAAASSGSPYERQSDMDVRARIPHRQHPCLQPPKCVVNLAVYTHAANAVVPVYAGTEEVSKVASAGATLSTYNSTGCSMNVEEGEFPRFAAQAKPNAKPTIPLLNLSFAANVPYDTSYNIIEPTAEKVQSSLLGRLLGGGARVAVAPA